MGYKLFLDDYRNPLDCVTYMQDRIGKKNLIYLERDWVICRNYEVFKNTLRTMGLPDFISFDHDLDDEHLIVGMSKEEWDEYHKKYKREMTGYDCALYLMNYCIDEIEPLPEFAVHSMNIVGAENILSLLNNFKKHQENI